MDNPKESLKGAKTSGLGRYTAVNLTNTFTVELRIFRGTLRYKTFMATLQFVGFTLRNGDKFDRRGISNNDMERVCKTVSVDKSGTKGILEDKRIGGIRYVWIVWCAVIRK